jgi:hypothetical protein
VTALVVDSGALIAFERNDRRIVGLVQRARGAGDVLVVPAGVLAQVWRAGRTQARLATLLASPVCVVEPLDEHAARRVGQLLGVAALTDVVDAAVVVSAWRHRAGVVTSDPEDLRRLDPRLTLTVL